MTWRSIGIISVADGAHKVLLAALLELELGCFKADTHHLNSGLERHSLGYCYVSHTVRF